MRKRYGGGRQATPSSLATLSLFKAIVLALFGALVGFGIWSVSASRVARFDRFNFVVSSKSVSLVSVDTKSQSAVVVAFPDSLYIANVAHGYGQYTINRIFEVGQIDKRGGVVLMDSVADYLGVPVDAYVRFGGSENGEVRNVIGAFKFALTAKESNLSFFDRLRLAITLARLRFDKLRVVELAGFADDTVLADGSTGKSIDREEMDRVLRDEFLEESIRVEDLRVEIINSTDYLGLGAKAARLLTNIGVKVVNVGTTNLPVDKCQIRVKKELSQSVTVSRIAGEFKCEIMSELPVSQGDVVVVLGTDYVSELTK